MHMDPQPGEQTTQPPQNRTRKKLSPAVLGVYLIAAPIVLCILFFLMAVISVFGIPTPFTLLHYAPPAASAVIGVIGSIIGILGFLSVVLGISLLISRLVLRAKSPTSKNNSGDTL